MGGAHSRHRGCEAGVALRRPWVTVTVTGRASCPHSLRGRPESLWVLMLTEVNKERWSSTHPHYNPVPETEQISTK